MLIELENWNNVWFSSSNDTPKKLQMYFVLICIYLFVHTRKKIVYLNSLLLASIPSALSPFRMVYDSIFDREFSNMEGMNEWESNMPFMSIIIYDENCNDPSRQQSPGIAFWRGGGMSMAQYNIIFTCGQ